MDFIRVKTTLWSYCNRPIMVHVWQSLQHIIARVMHQTSNKYFFFDQLYKKESTKFGVNSSNKRCSNCCHNDCNSGFTCINPVRVCLVGLHACQMYERLPVAYESRHCQPYSQSINQVINQSIIQSKTN